MMRNRERIRGSVGLTLLGVLALVGAACTSGDETTSQAAGASNVVPIDAGSGTPTSTTDDEADAPDRSGGSADDEPGHPAGDAEPTSSGTFTIEDAQQAYREFTDCMRNEGILMPPAAFDAEGKIDIDAQLDYFDSLDPGTAEAGIADELAAEEQCTPEHADELLALITPDASEINRVEDQLSGQLDAQLVELAQCMRETFPDFPDPVALDLDITSDEGADFNPFPTIDPDDPVYADAFAGCGQAIGLSVQP